MPMWCSSSDTPKQVGSVPEPHHRIVRIPPGESIVLNSAERAPYLLLIEIVHSDLDFDPSKRNNREVLKKILVKEEEGRNGSKDLPETLYAFAQTCLSFAKGRSKAMAILPNMMLPAPINTTLKSPWVNDVGN